MLGGTLQDAVEFVPVPSGPPTTYGPENNPCPYEVAAKADDGDGSDNDDPSAAASNPLWEV